MGYSAYSTLTTFARFLLLVAYASMTAPTPSFLMPDFFAVDVLGEESGIVPLHEGQQLNRPGSLAYSYSYSYSTLFYSWF